MANLYFKGDPAHAERFELWAPTLMAMANHFKNLVLYEWFFYVGFCTGILSLGVHFTEKARARERDSNDKKIRSCYD